MALSSRPMGFWLPGESAPSIDDDDRRISCTWELAACAAVVCEAVVCGAVVCGAVVCEAVSRGAVACGGVAWAAVTGFSRVVAAFCSTCPVIRKYQHLTALCRSTR